MIDRQRPPRSAYRRWGRAANACGCPHCWPRGTLGPGGGVGQSGLTASQLATKPLPCRLRGDAVCGCSSHGVQAFESHLLDHLDSAIVSRACLRVFIRLGPCVGPVLKRNPDERQIQPIGASHLGLLQYRTAPGARRIHQKMPTAVRRSGWPVVQNCPASKPARYCSSRVRSRRRKPAARAG